MIKISDVVNKIIHEDEIAMSSLSGGFLNLSGYAKAIKKKVEIFAKKPVREGSIVVALSRMTKTVTKQKPLVPEITLHNISAKSGLIEVAFNKTLGNQKLATELHSDSKFSQNNFYTVTQGVNEISIIIDQGSKQNILNLFKKERPKFLLENLAALTVSFGTDYIFTPNTTFALVRVLAIQRINIIEVVSTYTELTFILAEKDLQKAFALMGELMKKTDQL